MEPPRFMTGFILGLFAVVFIAAWQVVKKAPDGDLMSFVKPLTYFAAWLFSAGSALAFIVWIAWVSTQLFGAIMDKRGWRGDMVAMSRYSDTLSGLPYLQKYELLRDAWDARTKLEADEREITRGVTRAWAQWYLWRCEEEQERLGGSAWGNGAALIPQHDCERFADFERSDRERIRLLHAWLEGRGLIDGARNKGGVPPKIVDVKRLEEALS